MGKDSARAKEKTENPAGTNATEGCGNEFNKLINNPYICGQGRLCPDCSHKKESK